MKNGHQNDLMLMPAEPDARPTERAICAIVGKVSANCAFLEPQGNYNPNFEKTSLETSKVQFLLVVPTSHPDFETDFATSLNHIKTIQRKAIKEGPSTEHFIVSDRINRAFKLSWPIFEKRVCVGLFNSPSRSLILFGLYKNSVCKSGPVRFFGLKIGNRLGPVWTRYS